MKCHIYNKEPVGLAANMDSYFKQKPPDCSLFSQDSFEFQIHKELLFQTEYLREMIKSVNTGYSLSEAIILKSIKPKYHDRLFNELRVLYRKTT